LIVPGEKLISKDEREKMFGSLIGKSHFGVAFIAWVFV